MTESDRNLQFGYNESQSQFSQVIKIKSTKANHLCRNSHHRQHHRDHRFHPSADF